MKFPRAFGAIILGVGFLSGCVIAPTDADKSPVAAQFVLNESASDLYYRLTAPTVDDPACSNVYRNAFYQDRGEFRIYYGADVASVAGGSQVMMNAVYAKQTSEGTEVVVRDTQFGLAHERFTRKLVNFIKTGNCS
ncbi:hypothetical protein ACIGFL_23040 [Pseudomonas sp. NPDC077649]|uniref:hypothetical protein n=1 Tax=Pseudomonas sp. NPDC077649 TaxID=3364423 RepID=UPI0037C827B3